jgi:hypothetical protein
VEAGEDGSEDRSEDGAGDGGDDGPDDEGVPLPGPKDAGRDPGVNACRVEEGMAFERETPGVKELIADLDEEEKEQDLKGVDQVVGDLRCDEVEAEEIGNDKRSERGRTEQRVDANDDARGERPCELARGAADAEEMEDRRDDAALEEGRVVIGIVRARRGRIGVMIHSAVRTPETLAPM